MQDNFQVIRFQETPLQTNTSIDLTNEVLSNVEIKFLLTLYYKQHSDKVAVGVNVRYSHNQEQLLSYANLIYIQDSAWQDFQKTQPAEDDIRTYALRWFDFAFNFIRGTLATKTQDTALSKLCLPSFDIQSCKEFIKIVKI